MFSGIIQNTGTIRTVTEKSGGGEFVIETNLKRKWKIGESVLVSGICSTITAVNGGAFTIFYMPETLRKTTADAWQMSDTVNIEPSLAVGDDMSGHFVFGHIDGVATIEKIEPEGESKLFWFSAPAGMNRYLVPKGSVALDGVSLTVVDVDGDRFSVSFIPLTLEHTTFEKKSAGEKINFEADMLAKYVAKLITNSPRLDERL